MRIGANFAEKKETWMNSVYFKFGLFGSFLAVIVIFGVNIINRIIIFIFQHWLWVFIVLGGLMVLKYLWKRRRKK